MEDAHRRVCETYAIHLALGHEVEERDGARFVRFRSAPSVYDASFVQVFDAQTPKRAEAQLALVDDWLSDFAHRHVIADPSTPEAFIAQLALAGYGAKPTLQLLLSDDLEGPPPASCEIRPLRGDADWLSLAALKRVRDIEDCEKAGRDPWAESVTEQMVAVVRAKAPEVQFFLATNEGRDVAYFSSFPGRNGTGMVEDLFTHPEARGRGIARALIHHCVADARERGAASVVIGADPEDTPKATYVAMGFRPACLTWSWLKTEVSQ